MGIRQIAANKRVEVCDFVKMTTELHTCTSLRAARRRGAIIANSRTPMGSVRQHEHFGLLSLPLVSERKPLRGRVIDRNFFFTPLPRGGRCEKIIEKKY